MREYIVSPLHQLSVGDVMERDVPAVPGNLPINPVFRRLAAVDPVIARRDAWPIVDAEGRLVGILTRGNLVRALQSDGTQTVLDAGTREPLVVTYPDELLEHATQRMLSRDLGRLPVVSRDDPTRLVGWLGRQGITAAWLHVARQERVEDEGWLNALFERLRRAWRGG
jgi:CBS domain-containing protein